jgi:cytochrome P450
VSTTDEAEADLGARLAQFDIYAEDTPYVADELLEHARTKCPVPRSSAHGGYYLVSRYADVRSVLTNDEVFSSTGGKSMPSHQSLVMPPIDVDPPIHNDYRRLLNKYFSKAGLAKIEPAVRAIAEQLIDDFIDTGELDVLEQYATPLSSATLCKVILNLDDEELTRTATERVEAIGAANQAEAWVELTAFLTDLIRSHEATSADNVLDAIIQGQVQGRPLTADEKLGVVVMMFIGGLDTTRAAISCIISHLAHNPDLEQRLRDPAWITRDLDEYLRLDSVVTALARTVTTDTTLGATQLHAGDRVLVHYYSANRDSTQFDNADQLDFTRRRNPHLAFGVGVHHCLGANLARLQIRIAFDELLARVENIRLADETVPLRFSSGVSRMPTNLRVQFEKRNA